jgi:HK97 family phage prohead protease
MSPDLERRAVVEIRADARRIIGYAVVFDVRSQDLGGFVEVVRAQAVHAQGDIVALYQHDPAAVLGRTPTTLRLTKDTRGLAFELDPAPTTAGRDALALVQRGDITGASFGFRTKKDAWKTDGGTMVRELLDIEIAEISLTAFPAYRDTDVSIAQRSLRALSVAVESKSVAWLRMQEKTR